MKQGWSRYKLSEACEIRPPKRLAYLHLKDDDLVSFGPMADLNEHKQPFIPSSQRTLKSVYSGYTYFGEGDVILAKITPCFENGKLGIATGLVNGVGFGSSEYVVFRPSESLSNEFLYYFLEQSSFRKIGKELMTGAVGHKRIPKDFYENTKIPIPPLPEQKRIVAKLDQAFEAIDKAKANVERNLQNAKDLFQSELNKIFSQRGDGWVEKVLNDIGQIQTGTTPPTRDKSNYGNFIPFVKPSHFNSDGSIDTGDCMLSKNGLDNGRLFPANSVLMVCIGATIGKTGFSEEPVSANQQINCLTPTKEHNPKLFYFGLISPFVQKQVTDIGKGAQATLPIINKSKWQKLKINIPAKKSIQDGIVIQLNDLRSLTVSLEKKYLQELDAFDELKKSILQKAFNGEL